MKHVLMNEFFTIDNNPVLINIHKLKVETV